LGMFCAVLKCTSSAKEAALSIMCTASELSNPLGSFACKQDIPILPAMHQFWCMTMCWQLYVALLSWAFQL